MKIMKSYTPSMFFLTLVNFVKLLFNMGLTSLGLLEPPPPEEVYVSGDGYVPLTDGRSRSIVSVPVRVLMVMIKDNLPVTEYGDFGKRFGDHEDEQVKNGDDGRVCGVCLEYMEKSDEMRALCILCAHVFHRECIDTWVDVGRITCPLCRSTLYPDPIDLSKSNNS